MPLVGRIKNGPDTIRILLTTDNHVGCFENDPIRGNDGWKTFDEITQIAKDQDVDMLVQGGDLFHINKPTKKSMYYVMKSLRSNCMGSKACQLELLSDPSTTMFNGVDEVNYEDPNLNISIPVFAISGNHDDATGDGLLSALDVLAVSGLVNYFGKVKDCESITVKPILFEKGGTKLALYGMSNVRDERLHRLFRDGKVKFERPGVDTDQWFNFLVIHQNHAMHTFNSCIPENFLPHFLDFVLWGHEHECIPYPVHNPETSFDVLQAGSSIATSLSEGESPDKKVFIMNIKGRDYSLEPIELKTVRPFVLREIVLQKTDLVPGTASKADVIAFLTNEVEKAIEVAKNTYLLSHPELTASNGGDHNDDTQNIPLPLIRLRVEYSGGFEIENVRRFSNQFVGRIANVNDVVQFYKKKTQQQPEILRKKTKFSDDMVDESLSEKNTTELALQDIVSDFLKQTQLTLIPEAGLNEAVKKYVDNDDKYSLNQYINSEIKKETKMLLGVDIDDQEFHGIEDEKHTRNVFKQILLQLKEGTYTQMNLDAETAAKGSKTKGKTNRKTASKSNEIVLHASDSENVLHNSSASRSSHARSVPHPVTYAEDENEILTSEEEYDPEPVKTRGTRGGRQGKGRNGM
ncbi:Mre11 DNA double-strand break repair factor [Candida orthopsilosis Co 90-125]|uniref:Double-strand break repair protein n=1 Tax=Candida orthopsilosis (strain 90-125) TaxID=1136231 RepID=H8XBI6_CANO9|nr:Mre11 DNA double-strand break repair factor [Candida orthopsilosis Co 90-125]CCG25174.1 Mre11 DNA double-strand break repair factor [Candida orthopsilosis Co 90-125]